MTATSPEIPVLPFRPASFEDFCAYARTLQLVFDMSAQRCRELLARVYGYSGVHELQTVLKTPGRAGPFDEDLMKNVSLETLERLSQRRSRVFTLIESDSPIVLKASLRDTDGDLAYYLSPFVRPSGHRFNAKCLGEALQLVDAENWTICTALKVVARYTTRRKFDIAALELFGQEGLASPLVHLERARAYREPELFLLEHGLAVDTSAWESQGWPGLSSDGYSIRYQRLGDYGDHFMWSEHLEEGILSRSHPHKYQALKAMSPAESEAHYTTLYDFLDNPDPEIARTNPVLSEIPYIVELAQHWDVLCKRTFAKDLLEAREPRVVLQGGFALPPEAFAATSPSCWCSVYLQESHTSEAFDDMLIWEYSASMWLEDVSPMTPLAVVRGLLVDPCRNGVRVDAENFKWQMDAHSAELNDVWKVLTFEFFRKSRYGTLDGYLDEHGGTSFATASVQIHPEFQKKGLLPVFMQGLVDTLNGAHYGCLADHGWSCSAEELDWGVEWYAADEQLIPPVSVIVFPVEGTPTATRDIPFENILLVGSPEKVTGRPVDPELEDRRTKLEKHFLSLKGKLQYENYDETGPVEVLVYDPHDYPIT